MTEKKTPGMSKGLIARRDDWIRTSDPFVPNEVRYRAALHPENNIKIRIIPKSGLSLA